jgi:hypothetical protein
MGSYSLFHGTELDASAELQSTECLQDTSEGRLPQWLQVRIAKDVLLTHGKAWPVRPEYAFPETSCSLQHIWIKAQPSQGSLSHRHLVIFFIPFLKGDHRRPPWGSWVSPQTPAVTESIKDLPPLYQLMLHLPVDGVRYVFSGRATR